MSTQQQQTPNAMDGDLVIRARTDREAFGELYDLFYPKIFRYCMRRLFHRPVAEDVTSEVFLKVVGQMSLFEGNTTEDFSRWIYRIATNQINHTLRRSTRRRELLEHAVQGRALHLHDSADIHSEQSGALDWPVVYQAILSLKPREQSIITLRFFQQMSHQQIADVIQLRPATVRTVLSRALKKLRKRLAAELDRITEHS